MPKLTNPKKSKNDNPSSKPNSPSKGASSNRAKSGKQPKNRPAAAGSGKRPKASSLLDAAPEPSQNGAKAKRRKVIYEAPLANICEGKNALTVDQAKALLGWQEESENIKFGNDFLLRDRNGNKIRCYNNVTNRPLVRSQVELLKQEILRRHWRLNGETIIIGKTGLVLDGQHTLIALVLAAQERAANPAKYTDYWKHEPTLEKLVVFGIDEDDKTVNTINTARPRTLSDVIFRSEYFTGVVAKDRRVISRMTDHAVRFLWNRTGAGLDAFSPKRTHSESLDFLDRHSRLLEAVRHIFEENGNENAIGRFLPAGYAAGLLYLQATSATDRDGSYGQADRPEESLLDFSLWEKACEFWVNLAAGHEDFKVVRDSVARTLEEGTGSLAERVAVLVKAWNVFADGEKPTAEALRLDYETDGDGMKILAESPTVGGIDLGNPE